MFSVIAPIHLRPYLREMIYELKANKFKAFRVPDDSPQAIENKDIWVTVIHNPDWYSKLIRLYPRNKRRNGFPAKRGGKVREADSLIGRKTVFSVLKLLSNGEYSSSKIALDLIEIAKEKYESGKETISEVQQFFWETHKILLPNDIERFLQSKSQEIWEIFLHHYIEYSEFPYDFLIEDNDIPF